jgi:hypothetical protein
MVFPSQVGFGEYVVSRNIPRAADLGKPFLPAARSLKSRVGMMTVMVDCQYVYG